MTDKDLADRVRAAAEHWNSAARDCMETLNKVGDEFNKAVNAARAAGLTVGPDNADVRTGSAWLTAAPCAAPLISRNTPV